MRQDKEFKEYLELEELYNIRKGLLFSKFRDKLL